MCRGLLHQANLELRGEVEAEGPYTQSVSCRLKERLWTNPVLEESKPLKLRSFRSGWVVAGPFPLSDLATAARCLS